MSPQVSPLLSPNSSPPLDDNLLSEIFDSISNENNGEEDISPILPIVTSPAASYPHSLKVFSISLLNRHKRDHIRFHQCPEGMEPLITELISAWGGRLHLPKSVTDSFEYQLNWKAWSEFRTDANAVCARSLLVSIFSKLAKHGWNFAIGMELAKTEKGKDVLFFEKGEEDDPEAHIICMNFPKQDRIKVIGAPPLVINKMAQSIKTTWPWGLQQGAPSYCKSFEFKLKGFPWLGELLRERKCIMMGMILDQLREQGYKSYASVKITKKEKEMPTLFFRKVTNVFK
ncbi:uncharacterized protein LOC110844464 [Folsomia candida]|uniref:Uncharacterized protein n=1 Tax=Folsomia candida TaxID=158441 RepID=A0A226ES98_FOLCA|nr:uncharacterized protein LOC110844464 [Folsomia candida]OXA59466.1 hypothetical protein Fcan01_05631 [Folsomia candida]